MGLVSVISSVPQIISGLLASFLTIITLRVTYPFANSIFGLWTDTAQIMYVVSIVIYYLIIVFILWVLVWIYIFKPLQERGIINE